MPQEQQNIRRWLVRLTGPIFIEMVLIILLGIVDTVMLSQCSDNTVAAVGVVVQLLNMIFLVFEATTAGTSVLCSQFLGARQMDNVFRAIGVSLAFNMMMGVIVSAALFFGAERILRLMELRPELMGDGVTYMRIVGGFAFFQAISLTLSAILRSAGMAYYPMQVTFLINIINIIGNYTLIFGHFGFPALLRVYCLGTDYSPVTLIFPFSAPMEIVDSVPSLSMMRDATASSTFCRMTRRISRAP